ncbi:NAD(P)H-quinone oxidoreductase subunit S, chloroplastic [Iris pallida]|uniref:NAD(P)H-quinone oxidoreductase subunit S, chloroplastic n=1 Tax=Iris pallida TaxID=29817 RepID=A0AAX6IKF1_IRIPA|nr:NAD(P)H-quinone oxidoreductase subunit S, chloroplastic [Iris pallida]
MATPISIYTISPLLPKSSFLSRTHLSSFPSPSGRTTLTPSAKFNLSEIMGGRGLCNGEEGIQKELKKPPGPTPPPNSDTSPSPAPQTSSSSFADEDDGAFEKELLGLTGGFPGGEKGLEKFVQENPPPPPRKSGPSKEELGIAPKKPRAPELPLFMPGMIVLVKNPANPFHMYCGIVQRVTDGKAGVLFEGGNWDKLVTFKLDELERREKGPPMVNPKSAVLEALVDESA